MATAHLLRSFRVNAALAEQKTILRTYPKTASRVGVSRDSASRYGASRGSFGFSRGSFGFLNRFVFSVR